MNLIWFLNFDESQLFWTSIPGKQGQQMFGLLSSWNFHHVNMALVGGPMFFSNNMHIPIFSTHGKSPLLQTRWACIAIHTIFNKDILMVFPMIAWLSHNKQLIRTKIHKLHNPYHNSFLDYFPMSYKLHKTSDNFLKV